MQKYICRSFGVLSNTAQRKYRAFLIAFGEFFQTVGHLY